MSDNVGNTTKKMKTCGLHLIEVGGHLEESDVVERKRRIRGDDGEGKEEKKAPHREGGGEGPHPVAAGLTPFR
jgi:hypothetical protein